MVGSVVSPKDVVGILQQQQQQQQQQQLLFCSVVRLLCVEQSGLLLPVMQN